MKFLLAQRSGTHNNTTQHNTTRYSEKQQAGRFTFKRTCTLISERSNTGTPLVRGMPLCTLCSVPCGVTGMCSAADHSASGHTPHSVGSHHECSWNHHAESNRIEYNHIHIFPPVPHLSFSFLLSLWSCFLLCHYVCSFSIRRRCASIGRVRSAHHRGYCRCCCTCELVRI